MKVKIASTAGDIKKIIDLRYELLRKPWGQPYETSTDGIEKACVNAFIEDDSGKALACGRLQQNEDQAGQVRFMAVRESEQGKGLGKKILIALEDEGKKMGMKKIELQARENAVDFYLAQGYKIKEKSFKLWDIIQHYLMEKNI